jgi:hypothetical protein
MEEDAAEKIKLNSLINHLSVAVREQVLKVPLVKGEL